MNLTATKEFLTGFPFYAGHRVLLKQVLKQDTCNKRMCTKALLFEIIYIYS